jgi:hypothetical protein
MTVTDITLTRHPHLVLAICSTGLLMVGLDATIVNGRRLHPRAG